VLIGVDRYLLLPDRVLGRLSVDGEKLGFTLEDPPREIKIPKITGIPAGIYPVRMRSWRSEKFGRNMPEIHNVPGFADILIHWGNEPSETDGCLLVALTIMAGPMRLSQSRLMFDKLVRMIEANEHEHGFDACQIEITESFRLTPTPEVM
jgi:hypothetical protein